MEISNPENMSTYQEEILELKEENGILREEIRTSRKAAEIAADLVVKQFEETEGLLYRFQTANALRRAVLDSAQQIAIIAADKKGFVIVFNRGAENLLCYSPDEVIGRLPYDKFHLESELDLLREELAFSSGKRFDGPEVFFEYARNGNLKERECTYIRKDGTRLTVILSVNELLDSDGTANGFLCIASDISEIKRSEEALRESEKKYRMLVNNLPNIVCRAYMDSSIEFFDDKIEVLTGYAKEEFIQGGLKWYDIVLEEDLPYVKEKFMEALAADKSYIRQYRIKTKNGKVIWIEDGAQVVCNEKGEVEFITGAFLDITERKKAEEALRKSEDKHRSILEAMEEGYFELDISGNMAFFNRAVCDMVGSSPGELLGSNYKSFLDVKTADRLFRFFNRVYQTGEHATETDYEITRKDGSKRIFELSVYPLKDHEGSFIGFRGISRDITERMIAENDRNRLEDQLHQAQKLESIGTLAGGVAHDFNNILMALQGNATLVQLRTEKEHPNQKHLENIMALIKTGSDITRRILGFAKGTRYDIEASDLNDIVKNSTNMFARTKKEITIHEKYEKGLWTVDVDRGQIAQVLLNLYVNASDAMPEGGNLYIETRNIILSKQLKTAYEALQDSYVRVTITDTGTGMDEATKQRIFEPFFSTKERGSGTGLGLSSVYGIIKRQGGFIHVSSEKRKGTTFELYFPVSGGKLSLLQAENSITDALLKGSETILLVDDESIILDVGGEVLKALGYNVIPAKSGKEAIEILVRAMDVSGPGKEKALIPDLVILDMIMPEMGGAETFDAIKTINPDIKVLLASGYSIDGKATRILANGCNGFIQKPFNIQQISRKIREILES